MGINMITTIISEYFTK